MNKYGLIELKHSARIYTWTNNPENPIMAALDKIFCNISFEQKYPLAFVSTKARDTSDHVPLILDLGVKETKKPGLFRFEKLCLEQSDFRDLVAKIWATPCAYTEAIEIWQFKIRLLRKKIKGWAINVNASLKKVKKELLEEFQILDNQSEGRGLNPTERNRLDEISRELEAIWKMEEIKARQTSREEN